MPRTLGQPTPCQRCAEEADWRQDSPGPAEPTNPQGESQSIAPLNVEVGGAMSTVAPLEELHATIREAAVAGAQVSLSTPEHPYPMLDLMVKDAFAVVHYFAEDGEVPSQAEQSAPGVPSAERSLRDRDCFGVMVSMSTQRGALIRKGRETCRTPIRTSPHRGLATAQPAALFSLEQAP